MVNGFGPEGRAATGGNAGESKWALSKKAGVGKCKRRERREPVPCQQTGNVLLSDVNGRPRGEIILTKGPRQAHFKRCSIPTSEIFRLTAMYSSWIIQTSMHGLPLC